MFAFLFLFVVKNHAQDHTIEDRLAKLEQSLQEQTRGRTHYKILNH